MTNVNEEAIEVLKRKSCYECAMGCVSASTCEGYDCDLKIATNIAIKVLEQQPSEDCISTEMVIDTIKNYWINPQDFNFKDLIADIRALPSITSQRPKGIWIDQNAIDDEMEGCYECSNCKRIQVLFNGTPKENDYNYCPCCGSYNGGEEE